MDKIRLLVLRRASFAAITLCLVFLSGCETAKGLGSGLATVPGNVSADARNTWDWLKGADRWMQDNLW